MNESVISWLQPGDYWLARLALEKAMGLLFLIAFVNAVNQFKPLLGERGLLPVPLFVREVPFRESPSLFFFFPLDRAFTWCAWLGVALSALILSGLVDRHGWALLGIWAAIWVLYLSFVNVGQIFYGFGWESILLEAGAYAAFLGGSGATPQPIVMWLFRWLLFRVMFGAGLIKLRGDSCWRDLTCLDFHFETQPVPSPLTPYFHALPHWAHAARVVFNHIVELAAPFLILGPRRVRYVGGALMLALQIILIASGNLAFLNWLTLVSILACFDDGLWRRILPAGLVARAEASSSDAVPSQAQGLTVAVVTLGIAALSVAPSVNLLSGSQLMNS